MSRFFLVIYYFKINIKQKNKIILYWSSFQSGKGKKPASRQIPCGKRKKNLFKIEKNYIQLNYNLHRIKFYFFTIIIYL